MSPAPGAMLTVHAGVSTGGVLVLSETRHVIGRAPNDDIAFDNPYISREHAEILFSSGEYFIRDLNSKNGTFIDGRRLGSDPEHLRGGEKLEFGSGQVMATFALASSTVTLPASAEGASQPQPDSQIAAGGLHVDARSRDVYVNRNIITPPLSKKEFDVLNLMWERRGEACSKYDIAARGWPERASGGVSDQEISQCVHRIRARIEPNAGDPKFILSIRGFGYRLMDNQ